MPISFNCSVRSFVYLYRLIGFALILCLANTAFAAKTQKTSKASQQTTVETSSKEQSQSPGLWDWFYPWLEKSPAYAEMQKEAEKFSIDILDVAYLSDEAPKYYRLKSMHDLMVSFSTLLRDWLGKYGCAEEETEGGFSKCDFSKIMDPDQVFRKYMRGNDPLLLKAMAHMIHLVTVNKDKLTKKEAAYFDLCLKWVGSTLVDGGLSPIDWKVEYQSFIETYNSNYGWHTAITVFPESEVETLLGLEASEHLDNDSAQFIQKYLSLDKYPHWKEDEIGLRTVWEAITLLYNKKMKLSSLNNRELFSEDHVLFVLKIALMSPDLHKIEKNLIVYWLKLSEIRNQKSMKESVRDWRKAVEDYTPAGCDTFQPPKELSTPLKEKKPKKQRKPREKKTRSIHKKLSTPKAKESDNSRKLTEAAKPVLATEPFQVKRRVPTSMGAKSILLGNLSDRKLHASHAIEEITTTGSNKQDLKKLLGKLPSNAKPASVPANSPLPSRPDPASQKVTSPELRAKPEIGDASLSVGLDSIFVSMDKAHGPAKTPEEIAKKQKQQESVDKGNHLLNTSSEPKPVIPKAPLKPTPESAVPVKEIVPFVRKQAPPRVEKNRVIYSSQVKLHHSATLLPEPPKDAVQVLPGTTKAPRVSCTIRHFGSPGSPSSKSD